MKKPFDLEAAKSGAPAAPAQEERVTDDQWITNMAAKEDGCMVNIGNPLPAVVTAKPNHSPWTKLTPEELSAVTAQLEGSGLDRDNSFLYASKYAKCTFNQAAAVAAALTYKGWKTPSSESTAPESAEGFEDWWADYYFEGFKSDEQLARDAWTAALRSKGGK